MSSEEVCQAVLVAMRLACGLWSLMCTFCTKKNLGTINILSASIIIVPNSKQLTEYIWCCGNTFQDNQLEMDYSLTQGRLCLQWNVWMQHGVPSYSSQDYIPSFIFLGRYVPRAISSPPYSELSVWMVVLLGNAGIHNVICRPQFSQPNALLSYQ